MSILFIVVCVVLCVFGFGLSPSGRDSSVEWHSMNGNWRVIYPDGAKSQRFTRAVADDYRKIFGGQVVRAEN